MEYMKWYKDCLVWVVIAATVVVCVQKYRERALQKSQTQVIKAEHNLEDKIEEIARKVESTLKAGEFIYDFDNYSDQKMWGNRYSKLIFDESKQIYPNLTREHFFNSSDMRDIYLAIGNRVAADGHLGIFHGIKHDYLMMGHFDPNMMTVEYIMSEEAKKDIKDFEGFVESAVKTLRYRFSDKRPPSKKLQAALRDYIIMQSYVFYGLGKEHSAIRQKIIIDMIYQRIRKELEIHKPVSNDTYPLTK